MCSSSRKLKKGEGGWGGKSPGGKGGGAKQLCICDMPDPRPAPFADTETMRSSSKTAGKGDDWSGKPPRGGCQRRGGGAVIMPHLRLAPSSKRKQKYLTFS